MLRTPRATEKSGGAQQPRVLHRPARESRLAQVLERVLVRPRRGLV